MEEEQQLVTIDDDGLEEVSGGGLGMHLLATGIVIGGMMALPTMIGFGLGVMYEKKLEKAFG